MNQNVVIVQCCNCEYKFEFKNPSELYDKPPPMSQCIHYKATQNALIEKDSNTFYRSFFGDYIRIFCSVHQYDLKRCRYENNKRQQCKNLDRILIKAYSFKKKFEIKICRNHAICSICLFRKADGFKECIICKSIYCSNKKCGKENQCEKCISDSITIKEKNKLFKRIKSVLNELNMTEFTDETINILTEYANGISVQCCNKDALCTNSIITTSRYQFEKKIDFNRNKIYYYDAKYIEESQPTIKLYGSQRRIFCNECTLKTKKCKDYWNCKTKEVGNATYCLKHKSCAKCKRVKGDYYLTECYYCTKSHCSKHWKKHQQLCERLWNFREARRGVQLGLKKSGLDQFSLIIVLIASFVAGEPPKKTGW